jgi:hypothetical protein
MASTGTWQCQGKILNTCLKRHEFYLQSDVSLVKGKLLKCEDYHTPTLIGPLC